MMQGIASAMRNQGAAPSPRWATRMAQSSEPVLATDLLFGCCCIPCAAAASKSIADKSDPIFNFCCFTPCGSYSWVRNQYGIEGVCGDDLGYGILCPCCATRQAYTEARMRGPAPNTLSYGSNTNDWAHSLFDCDACDFLKICCMTPCMLHEMRARLQPTADSCCFDFCCLAPCAMYGQVRHSYGIITDFPLVEDLCLPLFCFLCTFNRAYKQLKSVPLGAQGGFVPSAGAYGHF